MLQKILLLLALLGASIALALLIYLLANKRRRFRDTAPTVGESRSQVASKAESTHEKMRQPLPEKTASPPKDVGPALKSPTQLLRRKQPPEVRGGRPRVPIKAQEEQEKRVSKPRAPKAEIICWKSERQWIVAVEIPQEISEQASVAAFQGASRLSRDDSRGTCWHLEYPSEEVIVRWNEGQIPSESRINLAHQYLPFKLIGVNQNEGRYIKTPSAGSYLVIVPDNWMRDETVSGPPLVEPEPTSLTGYSAHFFELEKGGKIAFRTPTGKPLIIQSEAPRFELVGTLLDDANENIGPLFSEPPRIRALGDRAWGKIKTIVIGEEGSGKSRWRTSFSPNPDQKEQDLPSEVVNRRGGWYFLRFYDENDDLVESLDFRFLSSLKQIQISRASPFPSKDGHEPTRVELCHDPACVVQPADAYGDIQIERFGDRTILTIPPDPAYDRTSWRVGLEDGPKVEVTILVERIWWALGEEDAMPSEWQDRLVTLSRDDFAATSQKALWLRLPRRRWVDKVLVGFQPGKARPYAVRAKEQTIAIPLRDFGDCAEIQRAGSSMLNLWLEKQPLAALLCEVVIRIRCKECGTLLGMEEDILRHFEKEHIEQYFKRPTYDELRRIVPSLPPKIYKCPYCDYYVPSDDTDNPTSAICNHQEKKCPKAEREFGLVKIRIYVVDDIEEIRKNVYKSLPRVYKCSQCDDFVDIDKKMNHFIEKHKYLIFEYA